MESPASCSVDAGDVSPETVQHKECEGSPITVDPFLLEVLENPRHRLTVLRMELDIQRFMQNSDQHQFEFQHLPTSYLRCVAHRVAQHYGLQTMAFDGTVDGLGSRVIARKTSDSKYPALCLSEVPAKLPEKEVTEKVKIVIRPRPSKSFGDSELGMKKGALRSVEERKEEYDKARARIFSGYSSVEVQGSSSVPSADGRSLSSIRDEQEYDRTIQDFEKAQMKDGTSRVAIFRDREKDRSDPDYDRSYDRYARGIVPGQNFGLQGCNVFQPPFVQYGAVISQFGHLPASQTSVNYNLSNPSMNLYSAFGNNQTIKEAVYMQWPSPTMMYANSYEHFKHAGFQAPFYQPLSFEHTQNC